MLVLLNICIYLVSLNFRGSSGIKLFFMLFSQNVRPFQSIVSKINEWIKEIIYIKIVVNLIISELTQLLSFSTNYHLICENTFHKENKFVSNSIEFYIINKYNKNNSNCNLN